MPTIRLPAVLRQPPAVGWLGLLSALLLSVLLYIPALGYSWNADDYMFLTRRDLSQVLNLFVPGRGIVPFFYRPLTWISYVADFELWGVQPLGWHLSSLLMNVICCALVWWFVYLLRGPLSASLTAILFAVHPAHPGAVTWIAGRADIPAMIFTLLCLIAFGFYLRQHHLGYYLLALFALALAILAKEVALVVPALLLLTDLLFFPQPQWQRGRHRRAFLFAKLQLHLPFLLLGGGYLLLRLWFSSANISSFGYGLNLNTRIFGNLASYIAMLLSFANIERMDATLELVLLASFAIISLILARWAGHLAWFGLAWLVITLIPVANITAYNPATRYVYPPSIGLAIFLTAVLQQLSASTKRALASTSPSLDEANGSSPLRTAKPFSRYSLRSGLAAAILALLIGYGGWATAVHNEEWRIGADTASNFIAQLKVAVPDVASNSRLFFVNIPAVYKRAWILNEGLSSAIHLTYDDYSLHVYDDFVYRYPSFATAIQQPATAPTYYFGYANGVLTRYHSAAELLSHRTSLR